MILTASEIGKAVSEGEITIDPFSESLLNPNSYNYRLSENLLLREGDDGSHWREVLIPSEGFVLQPNTYYLGATVERIGSRRYVPSLIGRSSLGRLGLFLQISADLGNLGAIHAWTLELVAVQPLRVYPQMRVGQVSFWTTSGALAEYAGYYGEFEQPHPNVAHAVRPR